MDGMKPPTRDALARALSILVESVNAENGISVTSDEGQIIAPSIIKHDLTAEAVDLACLALKAHGSQRSAAIRRSRNSLIPFSRLPVELTAEVLLASLRVKERGNLARLREVASVQIVWRDIILNTPRFWTTLTSENAELALRKSGEAPLTIAMHEEDVEGVVVTLHQTLNHTKRWKSLHCSGPAVVALGVLSAWTLPMPLLETMDVSSWKTRNFFLDGFSAGPRLRHFRLRRAGVLWTTLTSLTTLYVADLNEEFAPSGDQLVSILAACPSLESLELRELWPSDVPNFTNSQTAIARLPKLKKLILWDNDVNVQRQVVASIRAPSLTRFDLTEAIVLPSDDPLNGASAFSDDGCARLLRAVGRNTSVARIVVTRNRNKWEVKTEAYDSRSDEGAHLVRLGWGDDFIPYIAHGLIPVKIPVVVRIHFSPQKPYPADPAIIASLLSGSLEIVELALKASPGTTSKVIDLLSEPVGLEESEAHATDGALVERWLAPTLRTLRVSQMTFTTTLEERREIIEHLKRMVDRRAEAADAGTISRLVEIRNHWDAFYTAAMGWTSYIEL